MGGRSLGDRQDRIIGRFHHGGALALRERAEKEPKKFQLCHQNLNSYVEEKPLFFWVAMRPAKVSMYEVVTWYVEQSDPRVWVRGD